MRLPRDLSGSDLAQSLRKLGYSVTRQIGSHLRLTTYKHGEHHLTIPLHSPLRLAFLVRRYLRTQNSKLLRSSHPSRFSRKSRANNASRVSRTPHGNRRVPGRRGVLAGSERVGEVAAGVGRVRRATFSKHPARSLSDIAFVTRRRRCGQLRGRRPGKTGGVFAGIPGIH
jgi:predicted RNA binding protein YcfA (HicA-like mRNA interferase family)